MPLLSTLSATRLLRSSMIELSRSESPVSSASVVSELMDLTLALHRHRAVVQAERQVTYAPASLAKLRVEPRPRLGGEVADRVHALGLQTLGRFGADAPEPGTRARAPGSRARCPRARSSGRPACRSRTRSSLPTGWSPHPPRIVRPSFSLTSRRSSAAMIPGPLPSETTSETSRNASSSDIGCTSGVISRKMAMTAQETS